MRLFILLLIISCAQLSATPTLKAKLEKGSPGDYIVTVQDKSFSLLRIREKSQTHLVLEEVTVPESTLETSDTSWPDWLRKGAPGHSAWLLYEIDLETGELLECFSVSQKGWMNVEEPILPKMLALPLTATPKEQRKRVGPSPQKGEEDMRALWTPPVVFEGSKLKKPTLEVFNARWPDDQSQLAACHLELYFLPDFPFPFWIETSNGHYTLKIRSVACGRGSLSPVTMAVPHRPPTFIDTGKRTGDTLQLSLKSTYPFSQLTLYALDLDDYVEPPKQIPFSLTRNEKKELLLTTPLKTLEPILKKGHKYRWILASEQDPHLYAESDDSLLW
ncbi:MAG: hypothetical protein HYX48_06595 [Chlamydiales bacterium]|nr:hypothetical protein [Chlamydiales bacterium]